MSLPDPTGAPGEPPGGPEPTGPVALGELPSGLTPQTVTSFVAAAVFVGLAALLVLTPVPYVTWAPGGTHDTLGDVGSTPVVRVDGLPTYPTTGRLDLTVVSVTPADARLSLPQALAAYLLPHRDALPRDVVYSPQKSAATVQAEETEQMNTAQDDAVVAALRADGQPVTERPVVSAVVTGGPSDHRLEPGDLLLAVDGSATADVAAVQAALRRHEPGQDIVFRVLRDRTAADVTVRSVESSLEAGRAVVGISLDTGYEYTPRVDFDLGQRIGGPSAGLVFSLAIYDKVTPGALLDGRHVAGTGTISPEGVVGPIGGIQEKIAGAEDAGASVFLVPGDNCADLAGVDTSMTLVRVDTLASAISALQALQSGATDRLPHC